MGRNYSWIRILICSVVLLALLAIGDARLHGQSGEATEATADSTSYIFQLQLNGATVAEYTECSGLGSVNEILESETVTESGGTVVAKTPGAFRWYNITLRRTGVIDETIWAWRKATQNGNVEQAFRDGTIIVLSADDKSQVAKWTFKQGWAASLSLNGSVEELIIVHGGLEYTTDTRPGTRGYTTN